MLRSRVIAVLAFVAVCDAAVVERRGKVHRRFLPDLMTASHPRLVWSSVASPKHHFSSFSWLWAAAGPPPTRDNTIDTTTTMLRMDRLCQEKQSHRLTNWRLSPDTTRRNVLAAYPSFLR
jgi:hypothetical protein